MCALIITYCPFGDMDPWKLGWFPQGCCSLRCLSTAEYTLTLDASYLLHICSDEFTGAGVIIWHVKCYPTMLANISIHLVYARSGNDWHRTVTIVLSNPLQHFLTNSILHMHTELQQPRDYIMYILLLLKKNPVTKWLHCANRIKIKLYANRLSMLTNTGDM